MTTPLFYLYLNEQQAGPYAIDQIFSMWNAGAITADTLVWKEGMPDWISVQTLLAAQPTSPSAPFVQIQPKASIRISNPDKPAFKGIAWLKFWNYVALPLHVAFSLLYILAFPIGAIFLLPYAGLTVATGVGLHQRKRWGWILNWILMSIVYLNGIFSFQGGAKQFSGAYWVGFAIHAVILGLIWIWPNLVYWRKRESLFTQQ